MGLKTVNTELCSIMCLILKEDLKSGRNIGSPVAKPLCLAVKQQRGLCTWCYKGNMLGLGTLLKEDRAELVWTHLWKLHIMPFRSCGFSVNSCAESKRSHWIVLFLYWLHFWAFVEEYLTGWEARINHTSILSGSLFPLENNSSAASVEITDRAERAPTSFPPSFCLLVCFCNWACLRHSMFSWP